MVGTLKFVEDKFILHYHMPLTLTQSYRPSNHQLSIYAWGNTHIIYNEILETGFLPCAVHMWVWSVHTCQSSRGKIAGILRDKTMKDNLMYISIYQNQIAPFFRLKVLVNKSPKFLANKWNKCSLNFGYQYNLRSNVHSLPNFCVRVSA